MARFYTVERLGKTQSLTNEGFLLCEGVAIARTGVQLYGPGEVPDELEMGKDGIFRAQRDPEEVFSAETIASFEGKPVTLEHPDEEVTPDNWASIAKGHLQNVRRGKGIEDDLLVADVLITDAEAISAVRDGEYREVSCGYDADYEQTEPGHGRQIHIIGNHLALVKEGRAGSRCSIQDRSMTMAKKTWKEKVRDAFYSKDANELEGALKGAPEKDEDMEGAGEGGTHVHVHLGEKKEDKPQDAEGAEGGENKSAPAEGSMEARMAKLEAIIAKLVKTDETAHEEMGEEGAEDEAFEGKETPEEEAEEAKKEKSKDAKGVAQDRAARFEVLAPGTKPLAVRDAKGGADFTKAKVRALDAALAAHPDLLSSIVGSVDLKKASRATVDGLFVAASELIKAENNAQSTRSGSAATKDSVKALSIADINKRNREFWENPRA